MENKKKRYIKAYSLNEILIVLAIIGIIILLVMPNQTTVITQAKSLEAQNMLNHLYGLQKGYFFKHSKYSEDLEEIGFIQEKTILEGGHAVYVITILEADTNSFLASAKALSDFDGDGVFNEWQINQNKNLKQVTKD